MQHEVIPQSQLKVLLLVCSLWSAGNAITVRRLMKQLGWTSTNHVFVALQALRRRGLVTWEPRQAATIRPTCYVRLIETETLAATGPDAEASQ